MATTFRAGAGRARASSGRATSTASSWTTRSNVWLSSAGGPRLRERTENMILKFTREGKFLMQVGKRGTSKGSLDTGNFNNAADIFVYPKTNEVFVADGYVNRRVIVLDADTGAFKRMWGAYGNKPDDSAPNGPVYEGPGPQQFNLVHGVRVSDDGLVYVAERTQQPGAGLHDRWNVPARDLRRAEDQAARHGVLHRVLARPAAAVHVPGRRRQRQGPHLRSQDASKRLAASDASATTPASSSSCTTSRSTPMAISIRRKSAPAAACRSSCWRASDRRCG